MKRLSIILTILVLVGIAVLCVVRWDAWFSMPTEPKWEGDTLSYRFYCFGEDSVPGFKYTQWGWQDVDQPQTLRFIVLGDVHNSMDSADYATMLRHTPHVDAIIQLGDWIERPYFYYEQQLFHQLQGTGMEHLPVIACPGNHEYTKGLHASLTDSWYNLFRNPDNGTLRLKGSSYYVDFPNARLIVIDTQGQRILSDYTRALTWLKSTIQHADGRYIIVLMHQGIYTASSSRVRPLLWLTYERVLTEEADLVISGHDHCFYQRGHFMTTNSSYKEYMDTTKPDTTANCRLYQVLDIAVDTFRIATFSLD